MWPALVRRWFCRPRRSDSRPLAQFYFADEAVTHVTAELSAVDLRKEPQKYLVLLNQLRLSQDHMLRSIELVMEAYISGQRCSRDYHIKFPDEIRQENLGVQLWFAAECLSAGSFLEVREAEGLLLRPLAEQLLCSLEEVRQLLREQSLSDLQSCSPGLKQALLQYDSIFCQFELSYISAVMPVKSAEELQKQQEIVVLFCETVQRALKLGYITQELIDGYEPLVMFSIPRLAIICGLLIFPDGPLNLQYGSDSLSSLFRPFFTLLQKIRDLLQVLTKQELYILEKSLCTAESSGFLCSSPPQGENPSYCETEDKDCDGSVNSQNCLPSNRARLLHTSRDSITQPQSRGVAGQHHSSTFFSQEVGGNHFPSTRPVLPGRPLSELGHQLLVQSEFAAGVSPSQSIQLQAYENEQNPVQQATCSLFLAVPVGEQSNICYVPFECGLGAASVDRQELQHQWRVTARSEGRRFASGQQQRSRRSGGRVPARADLRARYRSSSDMVHRLFVCISGVADQLQTNFASDMRAILKCVFEMIVSRNDMENDSADVQKESVNTEEKQEAADPSPTPEECELCEHMNRGVGDIPTWVPDSACSHCTACKVPFTLLRRRHHCRSCGKIFCARCSSNVAALPHFGQMQPVRVCNHCFNFHIVVGGGTQL